jgi:hypothetical protein
MFASDCNDNFSHVVVLAHSEMGLDDNDARDCVCVWVLRAPTLLFVATEKKRKGPNN